MSMHDVVDFLEAENGVALKYPHLSIPKIQGDQALPKI